MKVTKILISQAIPGMIVARDIYTEDARLIITKGSKLTDQIITRLEYYSITDISIYSEAIKIEAEAKIAETTYYEGIKKSESFHRFHLAYQNAVNKLKYSFDSIISKQKEIDTEDLLNDVNNILQHSNLTLELFDLLHCIRQYDDTTYVHCLNVSLICNIIGKWLDYSPEDLEVITLCGLLHDIGKLMIPDNIIKKPARLTAEEFSTIKTHTIRGYNLLKSENIDQRIKNSALLHHERCDGSGYPYSYLSDQIDPFAKLVAIADVYDAMSSARVYRGPLCPFEVVTIFENEGYAKYDPKFIMMFLEGIAQTYVHNDVRLNNKMIGEIIKINKPELSRPIIKVGTEFIDLVKQRDLYIETVI
jgi:putative nucleotidyltransferase with HDIG domain